MCQAPESVKASYPFYLIRLAGGALYLGGMGVMVWNVVKTAQAGRYVPLRIPAPHVVMTGAALAVPSAA